MRFSDLRSSDVAFVFLEVDDGSEQFCAVDCVPAALHFSSVISVCRFLDLRCAMVSADNALLGWNGIDRMYCAVDCVPAALLPGRPFARWTVSLLLYISGEVVSVCRFLDLRCAMVSADNALLGWNGVERVYCAVDCVPAA